MTAEILAPAGSKEAFEAALAAGADAVFLGLPLFGARAYAKNFTLEEVEKIIQKAHLYGMKVYITMNTLLEEDQMEQAVQWARKLHEMNVDALIIQDLGLIHVLHHKFPKLELHASTQISTNNPSQIEQLKKLGISRVVLARECDLEQIEQCSKTGMELEVFVHGALCIAFSGQCQFSNVRYQRSGNKGMCAQSCRMEYTLTENGKPVQTSGNFLLSPKDLCALEDIPALEKAGVASLKIEGRMKSPVYVYESVLKARKAREGQKLDEEDFKKLKLAFNRGYTRGHIYNLTGEKLMSSSTSNHLGIEVGKVIKVKDGKVYIKLSDSIHQNDGLRFINRNTSDGCNVNFLYDQKGNLIKEGYPHEVVALKTDIKTYPGSIVRKTTDYLMAKETKKASEILERQVPISFTVKALRPGEQLELTVSDGVHTIDMLSDFILEKAKQRPSDEVYFTKQLSKTGDTFAKVQSVTCQLDEPVFVPMPAINKMKKEILALLEQKRIEAPEIEEKEYEVSLPTVCQPDSFVEVLHTNQAEASKEIGLKRYSIWPLQGVSVATSLSGKNLGKEPAELVTHLDPGSIVKGMNISNSYAIAALLELGYKGMVLSEEMSDTNRALMMNRFKERYGFDAPVIQTIYEKPKLMTMKHCPVNTILSESTRKNCSLCHTNEYYLVGKDGKKCFLEGNPECFMELYDEEPISKIDQIPHFKEEGIQSYRMVFTNESAKQVSELIERFQAKLNQAK